MWIKEQKQYQGLSRISIFTKSNGQEGKALNIGIMKN